MPVTVTTRGGIFERPASDVRRTVRDIEQAVAEAGRDMVQLRLDSVLRHPTGRYSRSIKARTNNRGAEVTDSGIVYGPWLEGVSSRNKRSRFKGYTTFRRTKQELQRRVDDLSRRDIAALIRKLD